MPFNVSDVNLDRDWEDLFACEWAARMHPPQAFQELMFPVLDQDPNAEADAIKKGAAIQLQATKNDPYCPRIKVTDYDSGKLVAGALWKVHGQIPIELRPRTLMPSGSPKRSRAMAVAHACAFFLAYVQGSPNRSLVLNIVFTYPLYRNQGVAGLAVEWGTQQADKLGVEAYVEGTYLGRKVYEEYGFVMMNIAEMNFEHPSPGPEWLRWVENMQAKPIVIMWRPTGGKYIKGETVIPWEGAPKEYKTSY